MSNEEFKLLNDFITQKCGITYHEKQKYLFQQKLLKRLEKNGLKDFREYYYFLKYNSSDEELQHLYNDLTVNETYFFREKEHLFCISDFIIPELLKSRPNRIIKILSAGCSTGEEPYSLAMTINENPNHYERNISIQGIDLSNRAIDIAKSGAYRKISLTFRSIDKEYLKKYFHTTSESYELNTNIKKMVHFKQANLFSDELFKNNSYDIILCRNVMIYFSKEYKERLINNFHKILNPDGYLILSNTENLHRINSKFELVKESNTFIYKTIKM